MMLETRIRNIKSLGRFFSVTSKHHKLYRILGIETSCDDTGVAIVDSNKNILGEALYSQSAIHALHGGIIPHLAKDLHEENIKKAVDEAVNKSGFGIRDLDAIAVTVKPGIINTLSVGVEYAKDLCTLYQKPLIPVHHMHAHALTMRLLENVPFPFLTLLISGGHCILALAHNAIKFSVLGETKDSSPGVLFDKVARRLKLQNIKKYTCMQGGVAIEAAAAAGNPLKISFPLIDGSSMDCSFTFSGLETCVKRYIIDQEKKNNIEGDKLLPNISDVCASFQFALAKHICRSVEVGMRYLKLKKMINSEEASLVLSGGVACNEFIRAMLKPVCDEYGYKFHAPPKRLCTDNGVMIAWAGIEMMMENAPLVEPSNLKFVECSSRCKMGESLEDSVKVNYVKGRFLKLKSFIADDYKKELLGVIPKKVDEVQT